MSTTPIKNEEIPAAAESSGIEKIIYEEGDELRNLIEHSPVATIVNTGAGDQERLIMMNQKFVDLFGYTQEEAPDARHWWALAYPDEEYRSKIVAEMLSDAKNVIENGATSVPVESRVTCKDGTIKYARTMISSVAGKNIITFEDITHEKIVQEEHNTQIKFLESVDKINRATKGVNDLDVLMRKSLDVVLEIFACDRASLITPCDPKAPSWHIAMESTTGKYPREQVIGFEVPMSPRVAFEFSAVLASEKPLATFPEKESILLKDISEKFEAMSVLSTALYPRTGGPWKFTIEQCSHKREWTADEKVLFEEIGKRLADSIAGYFLYCNLNDSEIQRQALVRSIPDLVWMKDTRGIYLSCNPEFEKFFGAKEADILGKTDFDFVPRELAEFFLKKDLEAIAAGGPTTNEEWVTYANDGHRALLETVKTPVLGVSGEVIGVLGVGRDITLRRKSEEEHADNLKFMESMDKINKVILGTDDLEEMMSNVLNVVLDVMGCDRAWLVTPCDPWTMSYRVAMEKTKPEWPGASSLGIEVPVDPDTTILFQKTRATSDPVEFNSQTDPVLPPELTERFHIQSQLVMEIHPRVPESWMIGMHQCSYERVWTSEEKRLFQEIGRRTADALTSLLSFRNLKQSEEKYSRIITTAAEGILSIDKNHKFTYVNPRMLDMLGYVQKEMLGHKFEEFILAEEMADNEHQMEERRKGNATVYDRRFKRKDGSTIWCSVSGTSILDDVGEYDGSFGMVTDITARKNAEKNFMEQEKFSQSLLRFSRDLEQAETYGDALRAAQDEIKNIVGYTNVWAYRLDEDKKYARSIAATGSSVDMVMSEEVSATLKVEGDPMLEAIANAKEIVIVEDCQADPNVNKEIVAKMGNRTLVNVPVILFDRNLGSIGMGTFGDEGVRVPTKSEQVYLIAMASHMAVAFDRIRLLEERIKTFEILSKNADELKEAQRIGQFGNFDWTAATDTATWSEEFYHIHGLDPALEPLTFKKYLEVLTPESVVVFESGVKNTIKTGEVLAVDVEYTRPNGMKRWITIHGEATHDKNNNITGIRGTAQDITEAKEIEKMRANFLMLASHQLRTPLSGTRWLIETLKSGLQGPINEKQREYLDYLWSINERMTRLVSDMLLAIRTESTDTTFQYAPVSIPELFSDITATAGAATIEKHIMIRDASSEHPVPEIINDSKFLSIILGSFIANAINYSHADSEIIFDVKEEEGGVAISVQDFGIGIPADEQEHVLERFYRASNAKSLRPEGTGLGLYIADMLARKMGGSITHTSVVNEGSTFVLHLPKR